MYVPFARSRRFLARAFSALAAACLCFAATASAQNTIHVPADQPSIQAGINAASPGDTVLVAPGTYYENINFKGKGITVTSSAGAAGTILDGSLGKKPAVSFITSETRSSVFSGFTVQNGGVENGGGLGIGMGGIYISDGMPIIANNIVTHNHCYGIYSNDSSPLIQLNEIDNTLDASGGCGFAGGAAIWLSGSYGYYNGGNQILTVPATVSQNTIQNNTQSGKEDAGGNGGVGVAVWGADAVISQNIIRNNVTLGTGAIYAFNTDLVSLYGNLIYANKAGNVGGVALEPPEESAGPFIGILESNTIYGNTATSTGSPIDSVGGSQVYLSGNLGQYVMVNNIVVGTTAGLPAVTCGTVYDYLSYTPLVFDHNDIFAAQGSTYGGACPDQTGAYGNISADPSFANPAGGNFQLNPGSPAIDAGNNSAPNLTNTDLNGNPRVEDATGLGYPVVDMGAYEAGGSSSLPFTTLSLTPSSFYPFQYTFSGGANTTFSLTAQLLSSDGSIPQGPVTFFEDLKSVRTLAVDSTGSATLQPPVPSPGLHAFLATYPGQGNAHPAQSVKFYVLFPKLQPGILLTSNVNPSAFGNPVTFTVTITSPDGLVLSPITLQDSGTTIATLTPSSGVASFTTSTLTVGYHYLTATYAGDTVHNSATASLTQQITDPNRTSTLLTSSPNPSVQGAPVQFNATITSTGGGTPTGSVFFWYGPYYPGTTIATVPVTAGTVAGTAVASVTFAGLPVGTNGVTAEYQPTGSFGSSSYAVFQQVLSGYATNTTLNSSLNPSPVHQPVTFSAHVGAQAAANGVPTGSVIFADGPTTLGTQPLDASGNASYPTSALTANNHTITATYVPTGSFAGSSASLLQSVTGLPVTAVLTPAGNVTYGSTDVLTITLSFANGGPTIGGTVNVLIDGTVVGVEAVTPTSATNATSSYGTSTLASGPHTFSCLYSGDSTYAAALCAPVAFTVTPAPTTLTLSSVQNPSPALSPAVLTAALTTSGAPFINASLTFTIDGKPVTEVTNAAGLAIVNATLPAGSHAITVTYAGDSAHTAATASLTQTAVANPTTVALVAAPNPAPQNQPVTIVAAVHATTGIAAPYGTVVLLDGGIPVATATVPAGQVNGSATASATFSIATLAAATHSLTATYTPADANFTGNTSAPLSVLITPADAVLSTDTPTLTVQTEHHQSLHVQLASIGGLTGTFQLSCGALPMWAHCYFGQNPLLLAPGSAVLPVTTSGTFSTATTLEIDTDAVYHFRSALQRPNLPGQTPPSRLPLLALAPLGLLAFGSVFRRRRLRPLAGLLVLLTLGLTSTGCGDRYPDHTEPGTYTVQVTATSVAGTTPVPMTRTATFTLVVTP